MNRHKRVDGKVLNSGQRLQFGSLCAGNYGEYWAKEAEVTGGTVAGKCLGGNVKHSG